MILKMFAVRDRQADTFYNVQFLNAPGEAIRAFADQVNASKDPGPLALHPDDFDLYYLGTFDTSSGEFGVLSRPESLALGKNVKVNGSSF